MTNIIHMCFFCNYTTRVFRKICRQMMFRPNSVNNVYHAMSTVQLCLDTSVLLTCRRRFITKCHFWKIHYASDFCDYICPFYTYKIMPFYIFILCGVSFLRKTNTFLQLPLAETECHISLRTLNFAWNFYLLNEKYNIIRTHMCTTNPISQTFHLCTYMLHIVTLLYT